MDSGSFWEADRPQRHQLQQEDEPGPSSRQAHTPMEKGGIDAETDQDPSVLEVPAVNWIKYECVKKRPIHKMGLAPKMDAEEPNEWDLGNAVRNRQTILHRPATPNDGNDRRPKPPQNTRLLRTTTARKHFRRIFTIPEETIHPIWISFLQRPDKCAKEPENNGHQPLAQGTSGHEQNVNSGKTLLVAQDYRSLTEELRNQRPLQNVR